MATDGDASMRVPLEDLDFDDEHVHLYEGIPFTGVAVDEEGGGVVEMTYEDGLQHGPTREWYPSGGLKAASDFHQGVLHGYERKFQENGSVSTQKLYEYGVLVRSSVVGDDGVVVDTFVLDEGSPNFQVLQRLRAHFGT